MMGFATIQHAEFYNFFRITSQEAPGTFFVPLHCIFLVNGFTENEISRRLQEDAVIVQSDEILAIQRYKSSFFMYFQLVKRYSVPRERVRFTLLFEALVMSMAGALPVKTLAANIGEQDTRIGRMIHHHVDEARARQSHADVSSFGVDETACKRGHKYVSVFVDMATRRVLFATEGKDAATFERFREDFEAHGGDPEKIAEVCCDMSQAFVSGVERHFPKARITFDRFHLMKVLNEAVDEVRREESKSRPELAKSRYVWLKNPENLRRGQREQLAAPTLPRLNLKTVRA